MDRPEPRDQREEPTGRGYSSDPADLFVQLYDAIPDSVFLGWDAMKWKEWQDVRDLAEEVCTAILESGIADLARVEEIIQEDGSRGIFAILLGLDEALKYANPYSSLHYDFGLTSVRLRYNDHRLLNSPDVPGALLPRCTFPGRPKGKLSKTEFFHVHRVPAEQWAKIDHRWVPNVLDRHFNPSRPVPVACSPVVATLDELEITFAERYGTTVFELSPVDSTVIRDRLEELLGRLDASGARIAVLPEGTLSKSLLEHWRSLIDRGMDGETSINLDFLLVGSGPVGPGEAPPNRAILLHRRSGRELLSQDKLTSFTLDPKQIELWRLRDEPVTRAAAEYTTQGAKIGILESAFGRLAIVICEDFVRTSGWDRELLACGVSHLLVPIFSKPIFRYRWEQQGAERQALQLGSWSMVSNSLAVGHAVPIGQFAPEGQTEGHRYSFVVAGPPDLEPPSYRPRLQFGAARTGADAGLVDDGEEPRRLPWVFPGAAHA